MGMVKDTITISSSSSSRATRRKTGGDAFKEKKRQKTDEHKKIWRGEIELPGSRKFCFVAEGEGRLSEAATRFIDPKTLLSGASF